MHSQRFAEVLQVSFGRVHCELVAQPVWHAPLLPQKPPAGQESARHTHVWRERSHRLVSPEHWASASQPAAHVPALVQ